MKSVFLKNANAAPRATRSLAQHAFARTALFVALSSAALITHAQTKVEPVVVTASRSVEALAETLRDVTVLRGETLVASGINDLETALRGVPGFEVQSLGAGATPSIFVRGGNSNQVLVLVDGQRVGSSFSGVSALQHIPTALVDRIEIVRGPAASLYGADAVSGVIQVFTKRASGLSANAAFGNQRSSDLSASAGFEQGASRVALGVSHRETRGYNVIVDPKNFSYNPDRDGYRFSSVSLNGAHRLSSALSIEASVLAARGNAQYDGDKTFDDRIKSKLQNVGAKAIYTASPAWTSTLAVGQGVDQSDFISTFPGTYKTTSDQASWQNNWRADRNVSLWNALEWRREKIASDQGFGTDSRRTASAAFGADATFGALKAAASLRIDDSNQYDQKTTGSAGFAYAISREWRVLVNAGTSFKAPTFNDLYFPGFSNPTLSPEKGRNVEAGLAWARGGSNAKVVVYENRVRELIQFQCDANFNCAPQNVAKANLRGATFTAGTRVAQWNFDASIDVADPEDATSGKRLARRAKLYGALKASGNVLGANAGIELAASGDRFDNASNTRRLGGYGVANAFARYPLMRGVDLGVRVDNAFDRAYENSRGYSTGGRRVWMTLNVYQL